MFTRSAIEEIKTLLTLAVTESNWAVCLFSSEECFVFNAAFVQEMPMEYKSILIQALTSATSKQHLPSHHVLLKNLHFTGATHFSSWSEADLTFVLFSDSHQSERENQWIQLIRNCFESILQRRNLSIYLQAKNDHIEQVSKQFTHLNDQHHRFIRDYLKKESETRNWIITASESFVQGFVTASCTMQQLDEIIQKRVLQNQFLFSSDSINLEVADLVFISVLQTNLPKRTSTQDRTEILLNRYEQSAQRAKEMGIEINGKTIAELMNPSVSPPAVSDALKKNRKTIAELLRNHPEKWPLIRMKLKPLQYLVNQSVL